ncbi:MAG: 50S ribosomal protein L25 [Spirochaetales bacterium]|nr:MAG: 50S ribosomal protein L25 [Spirochaetales bacterium]
MEQKTLNAAPRSAEKSAAARRLRREGLIPAIIYGHRDPVAITLNAREFMREFKVVSESQIVRISVGSEDYDVLVKDYQSDILTGQIGHIDFYEIEQGKLLRTHIGLRLEGSAIGLREGGILEHQLHELEIECLPKDIPQTIIVNISGLDIGDSVHVADLKVPEGVRILTGSEQVIAVVAAARAEAVVEEDEAEEGEDTEAAATEEESDAEE